MERIYLDNNSTTFLAPEVLEVLQKSLASHLANPSSIHSFGREARAKMTAAKQTIAQYFNVKPKELIFTSGGTEAINLLILGVAMHLPKGKILTSSIEHVAVTSTLMTLEHRGWQIQKVEVDQRGHVDIDQLASLVDQEVKLMVFGAVNSETGVRAPIEEIAILAKQNNIPLIIDGVAWLGKEFLSLPSGTIGIAFSSHKIHGPKGIGLAIVSPSLKIAPQLTGGPQEGGRRAGTENIEGILGFAKAIELLKNLDFQSIADRRDLFEQKLLRDCGAQLNGEGARICNTSNLFFPGIDGETLLIQLDMAGIAGSHGSACSAGAQEPSRVLLAMGLGEKRARSSLRFSLSRFTTSEEILSASDTITSVVLSLKRQLDP